MHIKLKYIFTNEIHCFLQQIDVFYKSYLLNSETKSRFFPNWYYEKIALSELCFVPLLSLYLSLFCNW